jgi:hypothetical protein
MLSVTIKPIMVNIIVLNVTMLNVVMLNVVMLNVVAPLKENHLEFCQSAAMLSLTFSKTFPDATAQCYKTFYGRNLWIFLIS